MRRLLIASIVCLASAGCATGVEWVKPDMTPASKEADLAACSAETSHLAADDTMVVTLMDRCMAERGYQRKAAE